MNKLRNFYVTWMASITVGLVLLVAAYAYWAEPRIAAALEQKQAVGDLLAMITSRPVILSAVLLVHWVLCKKLWCILHPELDFHGKWKGYTKYTQAHVGNPQLPEVIEQEVQIAQDCLRLRLMPSEGDDFVYRSRTIDVEEDGAMLIYAYLVNYTVPSSQRPNEAHGFEELSVVERDEKGRPIRLSGWFAHCARGQTPVLSGVVELERIK